MSDEMVPEEGWEEAFTCTASKVKLPVSEEEESMQWEEVSGADDEDGRCAGRIVSKTRGEVSTGLLSSGSEGDAVESEKNSAATETIERRNAVARIADTGGRVAVVRKKHVSAKKVAAGKKVVVKKETPRLENKSAGGKKCGDPKPVFSRKVEGEKRKLAKKVVGKFEVCSGCEFEGVLESKMFKGHLLKHYANDLREEFAEALTKKECPFSDHFKSDSRDGSHCNHAMLRHIGVTHGEVIKYHLLQQQKNKEDQDDGEESEGEEMDGGSILTRGLKFSSAQDFLSFMGDAALQPSAVEVNHGCAEEGDGGDFGKGEEDGRLEKKAELGRHVERSSGRGSVVLNPVVRVKKLDVQTRLGSNREPSKGRKSGTSGEFQGTYTMSSCKCAMCMQILLQLV